MTILRYLAVSCLFSLGIACVPGCWAQAGEDSPLTRLFDTVVVSSEPLKEEVLAKQSGWHLVPEDITNHLFSGDAVMVNDKLAVVFRKAARGVEVYSRTFTGLKHRASLGCLATGLSVGAPLGSLKTIENTSGAVMLEAALGNRPTAPARFRLTTGEAILEIRADEPAGFLNVESKARYVVVPDYFGDDMVYGNDRSHELALPTENFCLSLLDGGEAIIMNVWQSREQETWLGVGGGNGDTVAGTEPGQQGRASSSTRIQFLNGKSIWLAFLESPGLWHAGRASEKDDWKPPFPAKWRCSLVREHNAAESWDWEEGPINRPRGSRGEETASNPGGDQSRLTPAATKMDGALIVYPIDRGSATPLTAVCPTDVMRNTLGVGPCQYILACEGLGAQGDPTPNSVMTWVEKQFQQKKDKKATDDIKERLDVMLEHVVQAKGRIERYAEFSSQVRKRLAPQQGPEAVRSILDEMDHSAANGLAPGVSPDRARALASEVMALIGKPDGARECPVLGKQLRAIGAAQDGALARCRMAVRRLKAEGRTSAAGQQAEPGMAIEIQRLAEQMLQKK